MTPNLIVEIGEQQIFDHAKDELRHEYCATLKFTFEPLRLPGVRNKTIRWMGPLTSKFDDPVFSGPSVATDTQRAVYLLRQVATMIEEGKYRAADNQFTGNLLDMMGHELEAKR